MARRAVIYIRTSSETQGEKGIVVEQEADCWSLAEEKGLNVVRVYRDVEKDRVGNRMVEPSGSRSDRPGLVRMLKDAYKDEFDVIIAWREDRLYRGLRAILTVLETVQNYGIEILLAKENFDPKITPVQGIITLPALYLIEKYQNDRQIEDILNSQSISNDAIDEIITAVKFNGGIDYAYEEANEHVERGLTLLSSFPDNNARRGLEDLSRFVIQRSK